MKYYILAIEDNYLFLGRGNQYIQYSDLDGLRYKIGAESWCDLDHQDILSFSNKNVAQKIVDNSQWCAVQLKVISETDKEYKEHLIKSIIE